MQEQVAVDFLPPSRGRDALTTQRFVAPLKPKNEQRCGLLRCRHIIVAFPKEPELRGSLGKSSGVVHGRVAQDLISQGWSARQSMGIILEVVVMEFGSDPGSDSGCTAK